MLELNYQGTVIVVTEGLITLITPPQLHMHFELLFSAGLFDINTVGAPGTQGELVAGMQGIGVNTPSAAEVAAATVGFASEEQTPKGRIFTKGL